MTEMRVSYIFLGATFSTSRGCDGFSISPILSEYYISRRESHDLAQLAGPKTAISREQGLLRSVLVYLLVCLCLSADKAL